MDTDEDLKDVFIYVSAIAAGSQFREQQEKDVLAVSYSMMMEKIYKKSFKHGALLSMGMSYAYGTPFILCAAHARRRVRDGLKSIAAESSPSEAQEMMRYFIQDLQENGSPYVRGVPSVTLDDAARARVEERMRPQWKTELDQLVRETTSSLP